MNAGQGLQIEALTVTPPGAATPLVRLSATVGPGQILTVMGPSGAGKSTLLAALIGSLPGGFQVTGRVLLDGREVTGLPTEARRIGILFQDALLFPHLSVAGNLAFGLPAACRGPDRTARIAAALQEAGLPGFGPRDPATLSGGERARVALMRTLLAEPRALLLDEPFARLDAALRARIRRFTFDTARARSLPVLLVTHDAEDAAEADGPIVPPLA